MVNTLLCALMFLSGTSALIFETLWFRQAGLAFGNSVWASSLVLTGFMGGLAIGSAAAVWRGARVGWPIRSYAGLELLIAVSGVSLVIFLPSLGTVLSAALGPFEGHPWILNAVRLIFALLLLLVPSTAMGLTLPLLVKALTAFDANFGRVLGRLYGWNTLGAVTGAILAEAVLVEFLGIRGSALVAGTLNVAAALIALVIARRMESAGRSEAGETADGTWSRVFAPWPRMAFLAGFALLALEVIWFRVLLLSVEGSSLSFAVMLAVVLMGISIGGLVASRWLQSDSEAHGYATAVALGAAIFSALSYWLFTIIARKFESGLIVGFIPVLTVSAPLMFPVAFLSGVFFTLAGAALHKNTSSTATTTGILTFANTIGAAAGALIAGFVLLPFIGMGNSLMLISLLYLGIGLWGSAGSRIPRRLLYPATAALLMGLLLFPFREMATSQMLTAAGRYAGAREWRVLGGREGVSETVVYVQEHLDGSPSHVRLVTNSLSMSSTEFQGRRYMKLYVYLPVALHPDPKRALLISYGVGSTAKALTDTPSLEKIDVVDISRDILDLTSFVFPDSADNPLHDPRVQTHVEDGRYFLRTTSERYDLITGEPPPPQIANVVNLYTREYFQLIHDRLAEEGFVTYWLPLHSLSERSAKSVMRAFLDVFPDATLWHGWKEDVMLMGSRGARGPVPLEVFERQWQNPAVASEMEAVGVEEPEQLGALFIGDAAYLHELTRDVPPLVDDFPRRILADSLVPSGRSNLFALFSDEEAARNRFQSSRYISSRWPPELVDRTLPYFQIQGFINDVEVAANALRKNPAELHRFLTTTNLKAPILWFLGSNSNIQVMPMRIEQRDRPFAMYHKGVGLIAERDYGPAVEALSSAEADPAYFAPARVLRIYLLCLRGERESAAILAEQAYPLLRVEPRIEPWWDFIAGMCGIDPRHANP